MIKIHKFSVRILINSFLTSLQDKNPNNKEESEQIFKKVAEAYECLSDKNKRALFDKYGKEGLKAGCSTGGPEYFEGSFPSSGFSFSRAEDIFKEFFGGKDPFSSFFDDEDDGFGMGGFGGMSSGFGGMNSGFGGMDSGFKGGFGFDDEMFNNFGGMEGGGMSQSISTSTHIDANGNKVTESKKTYIDSKGNQQTEVTRQIQKPDGTIHNYTESPSAIEEKTHKKVKGAKAKKKRSKY